jgi:hypothetical protein
MQPGAVQPKLTTDLTDAQRRLVEMMSECQFGRVENMRVVAGQPVLDRGVNVVRVRRLGGDSGGTRVPNSDKFELKQPVYNLFNELAQLGTGVIVRLEFRRGLPCLLEITATSSSGNRTSASQAE